MTEVVGRGVYLRSLPDRLIPVRHSVGARQRAAQLQAFLKSLWEALPRELEPVGRLELLVVEAGDWRRMFSRPYGLPFTRTSGPTVSVVGAAQHRPRLLHRFDNLLLRAGRAGTSAPGEVRELLDLMIGYEWARAVAKGGGLRTRARFVDEFVAGYLFLQLLETAGADSLCARVLAWAEFAVAASPTHGTDPSDPLRSQGPGEFLGMRGLLLRAAELRSVRGWAFPLKLHAAFARPDRGGALETLHRVEPTLGLWIDSLTEEGEVLAGL